MSEKRLFDLMKKMIKENKTLNPILQKMVSDGFNEDEAIGIMINVWESELMEIDDE